MGEKSYCKLPLNNNETHLPVLPTTSTLYSSTHVHTPYLYTTHWSFFLSSHLLTVFTITLSLSHSHTHTRTHHCLSSAALRFLSWTLWQHVIWLVIHVTLPEPITLYSVMCISIQSGFPLCSLGVQMQIYSIEHIFISHCRTAGKFMSRETKSEFYNW